MQENLKNGQLRDAILKVLKLDSGWMTANQIANSLADHDIHTTEGSLYVTLNKMTKLEKIRADVHNRCKCCNRRLITYKTMRMKTISAIFAVVILIFSAPSMAGDYEMGEDINITITAIVDQLLIVGEVCNSDTPPPECVVSEPDVDTRTPREVINEWRQVDAEIQTQ